MDGRSNQANDLGAAAHAISIVIDFDGNRTAEAVNALTDAASFRREQDLSRGGGSHMEIYETISHVSTNQVWLHINSASSRVYFRPIALPSSSLLGWANSARSYLPRLAFTSVLYHSPRFSLSSPLLPPFLPPRHTHLFSFLIHRTSGMRTIVNPLSYSSPEIVSLNHLRQQHGSALLIALRYV